MRGAMRDAGPSGERRNNVGRPIWGHLWPGSFALWLRYAACTMLLHRTARPAYPQRKIIPVAWVHISELCYNYSISGLADLQ
jgi:hypothetical protein